MKFLLNNKISVIMLLSYTHIDGKNSQIEAQIIVIVSPYNSFPRNIVDRPFLNLNSETILETVIYSFNLVSSTTAHWL